MLTLTSFVNNTNKKPIMDFPFLGHPFRPSSNKYNSNFSNYTTSSRGGATTLRSRLSHLPAPTPVSSLLPFLSRSSANFPCSLCSAYPSIVRESIQPKFTPRPSGDSIFRDVRAYLCLFKYERDILHPPFVQLDNIPSHAFQDILDAQEN